MALTDGVSIDMKVEEPTATKISRDQKMSIMEIQKIFKEDFADEINDCNKYCDMEKVAEECGHQHLAKGLQMMAHDEYTHAKFIHENLIDWGCEIPEKEMLAWHQLKERVARSFR